MVPRNICCGSKDDIIARRYFLPALARSTPFNRAISCELKSLWNGLGLVSVIPQKKVLIPSFAEESTPKLETEWNGIPWEKIVLQNGQNKKMIFFVCTSKVI
jgi:hypothetical protein